MTYYWTHWLDSYYPYIWSHQMHITQTPQNMAYPILGADAAVEVFRDTPKYDIQD